MVASHSSTSRPSPKAFLSVGKAAEFLGQSVNSVRKMVDSGELESYRTRKNGWGHRRISVSSLNEWLGWDSSGEADESTGRIVAYCRVSSAGQKEALATQIEQVVQEIVEREGVERDEILVLSEIASSFGDRQKLNALCGMVTEGKVLRVYVNYLDRLSRVPSLTTLLDSLFSSNGVELVVLNQHSDTDPTSLEANMLELVNFITVISNRVSGAKAGKLLRKVLQPETIARAKSLYNAGYSIEHVVRVLEEEGHTATNKRGDSTVVSRHVLEMCVFNNEGAALVEAEKVSNSFVEFFESRVCRLPVDTIDKKTGKAAKSCRLPASELKRAYWEYMKQERIEGKPIAWHTVGKLLSEKYNVERRYNHGGRICYVGLSIRN